MANRDFYKVLGVSRTASESEIKKAFRRLAKENHPDRHPGDTVKEERFKEVNRAYEVLSDPKKRKLYDEFGENGLREGFDPNAYRAYTSAGGGGARGYGGQSAGFGGFEEIFSGGGLGDLFGRRWSGGGGGGRTSRGMRGEDIVMPMTVDFMQAAQGFTTEVSYQRRVPEGGNQMRVKSERIKVRIPPGAHTGSRVRLKGRGNAGLGGGPAGDLLIEVKVRSHPYFTLEGRDVHLDLPITFAEAALGAQVDVPTIHGATRMNIPAGTSSGQKLRLRGKGVESSSATGDQIVTLRVVVPDSLDEESRQLVEAFSERNPQRALRSHLE